MDAIETTGLTLRLGGRTVLDGVDLRIAPGEFIGVLGPNGAGKTTLFRALLGLLPPARGRLSVLGRAPTRGDARIGYLPQTRAAVARLRLSGFDLVAGVVDGHRLGLPLLSRAGRDAVNDALDLVGAGDLADRPVAELSGGQRQRLLLAQSLVGRPALLLLDEPLLSLDPAHQANVVDLIRRLHRTLGITVLFSAHELNPLLGAIDRVLYLGGGHAALGTVDAVVNGPVLSRLYGAPIEVARVGGRIFVMSGDADAEADGAPGGAHRHEDTAGGEVVHARL